MAKLLFPGFKSKALTFSYDDNTTQDRRLTEIFRKYGLAATFNINTGSFGSIGHLDNHGGFYCEYNRINESEAGELYRGFEVASHTVSHCLLPKAEYSYFESQVLDDCKKIGELCGTPAVGIAYPCGSYDAATAEHLKKLGIRYARTIKDTHGFALPEDFLEWHPTCHDHDPLIGSLAESFLNDVADGLRLFYIWGHSFEFDKNDRDRWADMDLLCKTLSGREDIWYATNREICDYITAARSADGSLENNNTDTDLYYEANSEKIILKGNR